ncbi:MAG TPA: YIP1 family protein [Pyrinomonadaceae bacterium]|nr:YIP1 family protein [Pyrinomonadaceae bacterium]
MSQQQDDTAAAGTPAAPTAADTHTVATAGGESLPPPPAAPPPPPGRAEAKAGPSRVKRLHALVIIGVAVVALVLGLLKVLPGGAVAGGSLLLLGLVLLGLSFVPTREPVGPQPQPMSAGARLAGIFFEPSNVFQNLRAHPRWLVALLLIAALSYAYSLAFARRVTPERIAEFTTEKVVESGFVPAEAAERMKAEQIEAARSPARMAAGAFGHFTSVFVITAIVAALYMLAVLVFGGRIGYWQALAVAVHAAFPAIVIDKVLSFIILYLKAPEDLHPMLGQNTLVTDNLGALVTPGENPVIFALASSIGVLSFYRLWLLATGLRHGSERLGKTSAWVIAIIFWLIIVLFGVVMSLLFPQFIS